MEFLTYHKYAENCVAQTKLGAGSVYYLLYGERIFLKLFQPISQSYEFAKF